jgi:hypothetical protein
MSHWEQYKQAVHDRLTHDRSKQKLRWRIGMIVIRVVEDCDLVDWADCLCQNALDEWNELYDETWDELFEDMIALENDEINMGCVSVYMIEEDL